MKKKIVFWLLALVSLILIINRKQQTAKAASFSTPVVTLGSSLTNQQKQGTLKTLTAPLNGESYQTITVTGSDLVKYLNPSGDNFTTSSGVWSSALIQKTATGSGIKVHLLDYDGKDNITTITANQYRNAALTAGITDANIYVTSAVPIDGSGALAGVYAAYAKNGNPLNQKQVNAAQDEINTLSGITQQDKNKKGYSDAQLNNVIAGAKQEMATAGSYPSTTKIEQIINHQIQINHLGNIINNNQRQQLISILTEIRNSGALKSNNFKQEAATLSNQIENGAKHIFTQFNTPQNQNWFEQLLNQIINFFKQLFGLASLTQV